MAIFYLDPIGGNDANNGLSFANRKKTASSITATAGDEIRFIEAPYARQSIGNATWTDDSATITFATPLPVTLIDPNTVVGWTAAPNVTTSLNTTTGQRKNGGAATRFVIGGTFTTGKACHRNLGTVRNLSSYEAVTFWIYIANSSLFNFSQMTFSLCSDATGDVPVKTWTFAEGMVDDGRGNYNPSSGFFVPLVFDNGGSPLPNNVLSLSIAFTADPSTPDITVASEIIAVKGIGNANHIGYKSLISKDTTGEPEWYYVSAIASDGTSVTLRHVGRGVDGTLTYRGTTGTVATYLQYCPAFWLDTTTVRSVNGDGNRTSPVVYTFGWNRTDMSAQTGRTFWNGAGNASSVLLLRNFHHAIGELYCANNTTTNGGVVAFNTAQNGVVVNIKQYIHMYAPSFGGGGANIDFTIDCLVWSNTARANASSQGAFVKIRCRRMTGFDISASLPAYPQEWQAPYASNCTDAQVDQIDNVIAGVYALYATSGAVWNIRNTTFRWFKNTTSVIDPTAATRTVGILHNCKFVDNTSSTLFRNGTVTGYWCASRINGNPNLNEIFTGEYRAVTQSTVTQTGTGFAWQYTLRRDISSSTLVTAPLTKAVVKAGTLVTITAFVRREATATNIGIRVMGGCIDGVVEQTALGSGAATAWQQVTLTFTPATAGIVDIEAVMNGANAAVAYIDNITVSQA